jgi:two-component system, OmpR family, phosphate regulon sensor histidine kinase PhoR
VSGSLRVRILAGYALLVAAAFAGAALSGSLVVGLIVGIVLAALLAFVTSAAIAAALRAAQRAAEGKAGRETGALVAAASQERSRLVAALNSSVDALLAVGPEGRIAFANAAADGLLLRDRVRLVGEPFSFAMPNEQVLEALRLSREDGERHAALIELPGRKHLQVVTAPIVAGSDWSVLVVVHDLTDVKRTEQVRRDFIANVSHELRTPLASLKSVIETLQEGALEDKAAALEFLVRADGEVDRIVLIMEELLELSRIESGEVPMAQETVQLASVLSHAVARLRHQAQREGVDLQLEASTELLPIRGDAERLERVAVNLVHNALKFTPPGGSVRVEAAVENDAVVVRVSDTGAGITPEDLPRIFERFYKADRARASGGTGLGLAIVKHTVEAHGGSVSVESAPGRGATFSFSIPVAPQPVSA